MCVMRKWYPREWRTFDKVRYDGWELTRLGGQKQRHGPYHGILEPGEWYYVDDVFVAPWHTNISLSAVPGHSFNAEYFIHEKDVRCEYDPVVFHWTGTDLSAEQLANLKFWKSSPLQIHDLRFVWWYKLLIHLHLTWVYDLIFRRRNEGD